MGVFHHVFCTWWWLCQSHRQGYQCGQAHTFICSFLFLFVSSHTIGTLQINQRVSEWRSGFPLRAEGVVEAFFTATAEDGTAVFASAEDIRQHTIYLLQAADRECPHVLLYPFAYQLTWHDPVCTHFLVRKQGTRCWALSAPNGPWNSKLSPWTDRRCWRCHWWRDGSSWWWPSYVSYRGESYSLYISRSSSANCILLLQLEWAILRWTNGNPPVKRERKDLKEDSDGEIRGFTFANWCARTKWWATQISGINDDKWAKILAGARKYCKTMENSADEDNRFELVLRGSSPASWAVASGYCVSSLTLIKACW